MSNLLTFTFMLQYLAIAPLYFAIHFTASSLISSIKSRLLLSSYQFFCCSYVLIRMFVSPTSTSMTASILNVSLNCVSPVGTFVVILYAHKVLGSSSGYASFAPLKPSFDSFEQASIRHFDLTISLRVFSRKVGVLVA